jgi:hypothetical protein
MMLMTAVGHLDLTLLMMIVAAAAVMVTADRRGSNHLNLTLLRVNLAAYWQLVSLLQLATKASSVLL